MLIMHITDRSGGVCPQIIQEVFCWTRLPMEVRRLAARKEDLFRQLLGDTVPAVPPGAGALLSLLLKNKVRLRARSMARSTHLIAVSHLSMILCATARGGSVACLDGLDFAVGLRRN